MNETRISVLPTPATDAERNETVAQVLAGLSGDPRLQVVVLMESGARAIVILPEQDRAEFERREPKAKNASVVIITQRQAILFGVL